MALKSRSALQVRHSVAPLLLLLVAPLTSVAAAALQTPRVRTHVAVHARRSHPASAPAHGARCTAELTPPRGPRACGRLFPA